MAKYITNSTSIEVSEDGDNISFELIKTTIYNELYPVGRDILWEDNNDHSNYLGFTWERTLVGRVPVGIDSNDTDFDTIGETGGSKYLQEHKHIDVQIADTHLTSWNSKTGNQGIFSMESLVSGNGTENQNRFLTGNVHEIQTGDSGNLQPFQVVAWWKRVA